MVIVPSSTLHSVGSVETTFRICGAAGAPIIIGLSVEGVSQLPSVFLAMTLYVPAARFENVFEICQLIPPSMEYSKLVPVEFTVIVPSSTPQLVGSVVATLLMTGC